MKRYVVKPAAMLIFPSLNETYRREHGTSALAALSLKRILDMANRIGQRLQLFSINESIRELELVGIEHGDPEGHYYLSIPGCDIARDAASTEYGYRTGKLKCNIIIHGTYKEDESVKVNHFTLEL